MKEKISELEKHMRQYELSVEKSIGEQVQGQDILDPMRFSGGVCHMIVFRLLVNREYLKDTKVRAFLSEIGLQRAINEQNQGLIYIEKHAMVQNGHLYYKDPPKISGGGPCD